MLFVDLVGRDRELSAVERALDDVLDGAGRVLAVLGEAGIGKSALLAAMAETARGRGVRVLERRAAEHEQYVPFSVVDDALVEQLGGERPVVLLLDDMHWADQASLDLVRQLLHRPPAAPHLLVVAARRRGSRALPLLDLARRLPAYEELALEPLDREASLTLLAEVPDVAERERMVDDARGIPLYLREFARTVGRPASTLTCPLLAAAEVELRALPPATRSLVEGAAVAGDPFDPELAAAAAGLEHVAEALDELVAADIIRARRRAQLRLPAPAGLPRRLPRRGAGLAAGRPRARRGRAGAARRGRGGAGAPRRAVRAAGRRGGGRAARRGGRARRAAHWYEAALRLVPDRERAPPAGAGRARAGARPGGCARPSRCSPSSTARSPSSSLARAQLEATLGDPDAARRRLRPRRPRRRRSRSSSRRWTSSCARGRCDMRRSTTLVAQLPPWCTSPALSCATTGSPTPPRPSSGRWRSRTATSSRSWRSTSCARPSACGSSTSTAR